MMWQPLWCRNEIILSLKSLTLKNGYLSSFSISTGTNTGGEVNERIMPTNVVK